MAVPRAMHEVVAAESFYEAPYWPSAVGLEAGPRRKGPQGGPAYLRTRSGSWVPPPSCWLPANAADLA